MSARTATRTATREDATSGARRRRWATRGAAAWRRPRTRPPPRGRDTRPTPEREDYRKGYEAAKKEMLRNLSGATDEGPSRDTSRARRRDDSPPPRRRDDSPVRRERRRDSPERAGSAGARRERRERRRDSPERRERRRDSPERRERRRDSPERRSRERRRDDSREGRREQSRNRAGRAESREGRRDDSRARRDDRSRERGAVWRERDEALRRSEETWQRSEARAQAAAPRRRSPTPDNRRRRSPSPECKEADDDYSLAPATRGVLMDDDAVSEASEAASELTADDDALSPVKPLRAMSKTSTRGRLQPMAFEDVLTVPTPLEPPSGTEDPAAPMLLGTEEVDVRVRRAHAQVRGQNFTGSEEDVAERQLPHLRRHVRAHRRRLLEEGRELPRQDHGPEGYRRGSGGRLRAPPRA